MQQDRVILLQGKEVAEFELILDSIPHGYVKKIVQFINLCQSKRQLERADDMRKSLPNTGSDLKNPAFEMK